jgi:hypothetical protein
MLMGIRRRRDINMVVMMAMGMAKTMVTVMVIRRKRRDMVVMMMVMGMAKTTVMVMVLMMDMGMVPMMVMDMGPRKKIFAWKVSTDLVSPFKFLYLTFFIFQFQSKLTSTTRTVPAINLSLRSPAAVNCTR